MAITYSFHAENDLLLVQASGADENLHEVEAYGEAIITAALEHQSTKILCDERQLTYLLGTLDTFLAAEYIAKVAPKVGRIAIICANKHWSEGQFWETVAVNRGLRVRMFLSPEQARAWLEE